MSMRGGSCSIALVLLLGACNGGALPVIDGQDFLSTMEGPKVPTVKDALLDGAKNAEKDGNFAGAAQYYRQLLEKDPENKEIALLLADSYRRMGDIDQSVTLYDALIEKNPDMMGAKEGKALALIAKGDYETPAALLGEVMKADPARWKTLNGLGILFSTRGMHPEAQQYFQEALKHSPANNSVLNNLGLAQALDRQYDVGIKTLNQAASAAKAETPVRKRIDLNLALVHAVAGHLDEARAIASVYYSGAALNNNMGLYAHLAKDDALAKAYLNMALVESKTYYGKAWDNLETLKNITSDTATRSSLKAMSPAPKASTAKSSKKEKKTDTAEKFSKSSPVKEQSTQPVEIKSSDSQKDGADAVKPAVTEETKPEPKADEPSRGFVGSIRSLFGGGQKKASDENDADKDAPEQER